MTVAWVFISEISRARIQRHTAPYLLEPVEEEFEASLEKIIATMTHFSANCLFMGKFYDFLCSRPERNAAESQLAAIRQIYEH